MPDSFWTPPAEGATADWQAMAEKVSKSYGEAQKKITTQGEALAKHTVPDSVTPYMEGLDPETLLKTHERAGFTPEMLDQAAAQARSAGIGPGAFQGFMQSWLKSRHEATAAPQSSEQRHEAAVAELNAQGRPGSEMAKRVRTWGAGLVRENKISEKQAAALEGLLHTADGIEVLHSVMGQTPAPLPDGNTATRAGSAIVEEIEKLMDDDRYGTDPVYTEQVIAKAQRHESLLGQKYQVDGLGLPPA